MSGEGRALVIAHRGKTPRPAGPLPAAHGGIADKTHFVEFFTRQELVAKDGVLPLPAHNQGASIWLMG
jgi:hypothetical protein